MSLWAAIPEPTSEARCVFCRGARPDLVCDRGCGACFHPACYWRSSPAGEFTAWREAPLETPYAFVCRGCRCWSTGSCRSPRRVYDDPDLSLKKVLTCPGTRRYVKAPTSMTVEAGTSCSRCRESSPTR